MGTIIFIVHRPHTRTFRMVPTLTKECQAQNNITYSELHLILLSTVTIRLAIGQRRKNHSIYTLSRLVVLAQVFETSSLKSYSICIRLKLMPCSLTLQVFLESPHS